MALNLTENRSQIRWGIVAFAVLIGIVSIFYTQDLVQEIAEREQRQIELYAKGLEFIGSSNLTGDYTFLMDEIIEANHTIPVIMTDQDGNPIDSRNLNAPENPEAQDKFLRKQLKRMKKLHSPVKMQIDTELTYYVYYSDSELIRRLQYFPYVQLTFIFIFFVLVYFIFRAARQAEQNSVWVGLAKETAHQLGTPLSSLMAWVEYFKVDEDFDQSIVTELEKDIARFQMITNRFSSIGSVPTLKPEDVYLTASGIVEYLKKRVSSKVKFRIGIEPYADAVAPINKPLFEWVIENICKNAVDAMSGRGEIEIYIRTTKDDRKIYIDIKDTGKGMSPSKFRDVFRPGFTTKKRGWGLGLTLVKRIVENYHDGKIFVLRSEVNVGTTFRIIIPKEDGVPIEINTMY